MFEYMDFNGLEQEFNKYINIRGKYMYLQFYNVLLSNNCVNYKDIRSCIIYDKNLRDTLYIYLSTFEECLRLDILNNYDLKSDFKYNKKNKEKYVEQMAKFVYKSQNSETSNLYYNLNLDLGDLIQLCKIVNIYDDNKIRDLQEIRQLRNNVMHHNLLILSDSKNYDDMLKHRDLVRNRICILSKYLPQSYINGFIKDINSIPCDRNDYKVML